MSCGGHPAFNTAGRGFSDSGPIPPHTFRRQATSDSQNTPPELETEYDPEEPLENEVAVSVEGGLPVTSAVEGLVSELEEDAARLLQSLSDLDYISGPYPLHPTLSNV